jgi:hypothetical protein
VLPLVTNCPTSARTCCGSLLASRDDSTDGRAKLTSRLCKYGHWALGTVSVFPDALKANGGMGLNSLGRDHAIRAMALPFDDGGQDRRLCGIYPSLWVLTQWVLEL